MTLKDDAAQIRAVMWRSTAAKLRFDLKEGQHVIALGGIEVYAPQGVYQLNLRKIEPQGIGALQLAFEQLQQRLRAEGLFDPAKKKPLPAFPLRIAVVTSSTGAAVRDFLEIALRRWPRLHVTIIPAMVQGPGAAKTIVAGIRAAQKLNPTPDVVVVTRGGGSMEDLWCFNEEIVVRAIAACRLPTVSAVGHEIDVTLADFAADVRALTPSDAALRIVPEVDSIVAKLDDLTDRLAQPVQRLLQYHRRQLDLFSQRSAFRRPHETIRRQFQRLDDLDLRAKKAVEYQFSQYQNRLRTSAASLASLSPLHVIGRGYTLTTSTQTGRLIRTIDDVKATETIQTQTSDGVIHSSVTHTSPQA